MKKENDVFEDLKERFDNCTFCEDEEMDSAIKDNFKKLVERAERDMKMRQEFAHSIATIVGCIALYGKDGIFWAAQMDDPELKFIKEYLEEFLKYDKIEIDIKNGTIEFKKKGRK